MQFASFSDKYKMKEIEKDSNCISCFEPWKKYSEVFYSSEGKGNRTKNTIKEIERIK